MLRDYEPGDWTTDQFKLSENAEGTVKPLAPLLAFPCCVCVYGAQDQDADPCCRCGHNVNSSASRRAGREGVV